jgi:1-deoxy-D-xylulose-5-phosphate reductoisomerase
MTRVALLGATGSIGRQAIEIIESNPGLELVAAASGSTPIDGLAPLTQVGGDLTELLERAEPDVVLNAVMGFAGLPATLWALEHGVKLTDVTPEQALAHPTWQMGRKITVDSATLANKGLELIEAHFLFGVAYEKIDIVIHPTSIVHGLARFRDGASLAHLGHPDMRVPISFALTYPERAATPVQRLELAGTTLEFEEPDVETFPLLRLAREAGERGGTFPCVFNAANEAFLDSRLPFLGIADAVDEALSVSEGAPARDLADLVEADASARKVAAAVSA